MSSQPSAKDYRRIAREIGSDASPVGIDAKKTHVMILYKLEEIERRLAALEARALAWVVEALGLPAGCGGGLVTGATMANVTGLAAARHGSADGV